MSGSRCDCDKVFIRDRVASRCTCSCEYRIREIIMRAFISFDKRLCRLQFCAPFANAMFREGEKSTRLFQEKRAASSRWGGRRINEWRALLMYRISVDESRRSLCLCDTRNAANCLYAIRESSDAKPRCTSQRIILGSAIFWMNAGTVGYKNIVTSRRDDNVAVHAPSVAVGKEWAPKLTIAMFSRLVISP